MPRGKLKSATLAVEFLDRYRSTWEKAYGVKSCAKHTGRDLIRVKEVIEAHGMRGALTALSNYFTDSSGWLSDKRHPLRVFISQVDQFVEVKNGKGKTGIKFDADHELETERGRRKRDD